MTVLEKSAAKKAMRKSMKNTLKQSYRAPSQPTHTAGDIEVYDQKPKLVKETARLVEAILTQNCPYALPRPAGAYVAPHQFSWEKVIQLDTAAKLKTALLVSNNLDNILSIGQPAVGATTIPANTTVISMNQVSVPQGSVCYDASLPLGNNQVFKTSTLPLVAGYSHFSSSTNKFAPGFKYYPGTVALMNPVTLTFYNASGNAGALTLTAGHVTGGAPVTDITHNIVVAANPALYSYDLSTDPGWAAFIAALGAAQGFWFAWAFAPTNGNMSQPYGFNVSESFTGNTILNSPLIWTKYALWDLMADGVVAYAQFQKSARHNVTGQIMTLTNTTSELIKGGSVFAARLPGDTYGDLGNSVDEIISIVSSQVHHKLKSCDLARGMSYSFTPEKLQDWLFERNSNFDPYNGNPENIPYCAIALDATNSGLNNGNPTFTLTGTVSVEYLTTDPSNWFVSSPSIEPIFDAILNALAQENCLSHNPDHIAHLKGVVKRVMTSDNMKYALKTMIGAGIKAAPFILSLL